jgi:hypothetical protein
MGSREKGKGGVTSVSVTLGQQPLPLSVFSRTTHPLPYDSPMPQINPDSMIAIQPELTSGESILWAGQPKTRARSRQLR